MANEKYIRELGTAIRRLPRTVGSAFPTAEALVNQPWARAVIEAAQPTNRAPTIRENDPYLDSVVAEIEKLCDPSSAMNMADILTEISLIYGINPEALEHTFEKVLRVLDLATEQLGQMQPGSAFEGKIDKIVEMIAKAAEKNRITITPSTLDGIQDEVILEKLAGFVQTDQRNDPTQSLPAGATRLG